MNVICRKIESLLVLMGVFLFVGVAALAVPVQMVTRVDSTVTAPAGGNGDSFTPMPSADGRYVAFASSANNLLLASNNLPIPATLPARINVFLRDRTNKITTLVSASTNGVAGGNGDSFPVAISTNNRFVLFQSSASNLVAGDANNATDIFIRDVVNGTTLLVSANTSGNPGNGISRAATMTPDARHVAFVSHANNLVADDTNNIADIFVRDTQLGITTLASVGAKSASGSCEAPEITPDGRYVAFYATATNLVPGVPTTTANGDIYVRDLLGASTAWASTNARSILQTEQGSTAVQCFSHLISTNGNYVAFEISKTPASTTTAGIVVRHSLDTGLTEIVNTNCAVSTGKAEEFNTLAMTPDGRFIAYVANTNGSSGLTRCIYVWDVQTGVSTLVSGDLSGAVATNSICAWPAITPDGQFVAFLSNATNLVTNVLSGEFHLYRRDVAGATTALVDVDTNEAGSGVTAATAPRMADDGSFIAFECDDGGLVADDSNRRWDVFVRELGLDSNELISARHATLTSFALNGSSTMTDFSPSADGRWIAFASDADNVVAGDTNGFRDVFVRDLVAGTNCLVSAGLGGEGGNGPSFEPVISADGRYVAFTSGATNLVSGDANKVTDVFVHDLDSGTTALASMRYIGTSPGNKASASPTISADGRWLLFWSQATDLLSGTFSSTSNLFLRDLPAGTNVALSRGGLTSSAMTPDGRYVAFVGAITYPGTSYLYVWGSLAGARVFTNTTTAGITNLAISPDGSRIAGATSTQLWLMDRPASTNWVVTALASGSRPLQRFSADGNWLVYSRLAGTINQVFQFDLVNRTEQLISHTQNPATGGSGHSDLPVFSPDGRFVAYRTYATDIVAGANGLARQLILYDRQTGANSLVSASRYTGAPSIDRSVRATFSADGQMLLYQSWASDLADGSFNTSGALFRLPILTALILPPAVPGQGPWLAWPAVPDGAYGVEYKNSLNDPLWQSLPGSITNNGFKAMLQDTSPDAARRFYRVVSF
jgi:Tol biopolymer transport system component